MAFLTVRNPPPPPHFAIELLMNLTVFLILTYSDEVYRYVFLSLLPFIKKEKKIPHHNVDVIFTAAVSFVTGAPFSIHHCCLYSLWPLLHPCRQSRSFQVIYRCLIGENPFLQSLFLIFTTLITVSVLVASLLSSYRKLRPPSLPLFRFLLQMTGIICKAPSFLSVSLISTRS